MSNLVAALASNGVKDIDASIEEVLDYILAVCDHYRDALDFQNRELDYQGFLSGFLMSF